MYIDKIEVSDISDQLSSATLQKIFTLIYVNKKMNVNRNSVRTINIYHYINIYSLFS